MLTAPLTCGSLGGGEGIRTPDLCRAKAALYRAELHPPGTPQGNKGVCRAEQRNEPYASPCSRRACSSSARSMPCCMAAIARSPRVFSISDRATSVDLRRFIVIASG